MTEAFTAGVMVFIEQFRARWPWSVGVGILTVDVVVFFRNLGVFHSQDSLSSTFSPRLWETSSGVVAAGVFAAEARREQRPLLMMFPTAGDETSREGILRMENAGISEEDDSIDSQDSNTPIDHGHLARNCSIKKIKKNY